MNEWCIEVRWGFKPNWTPLANSESDSEEEALKTIEVMRRVARETDKPWLWAYRDLPMRAAKRTAA